jgi:hypothetical protein
MLLSLILYIKRNYVMAPAQIEFKTLTKRLFSVCGAVYTMCIQYPSSPGMTRTSKIANPNVDLIKNASHENNCTAPIKCGSPIPWKSVFFRESPDNADFH